MLCTIRTWAYFKEKFWVRKLINLMFFLTLNAYETKCFSPISMQCEIKIQTIFLNFFLFLINLILYLKIKKNLCFDLPTIYWTFSTQNCVTLWFCRLKMVCGFTHYKCAVLIVSINETKNQQQHFELHSITQQNGNSKPKLMSIKL